MKNVLMGCTLLASCSTAALAQAPAAPGTGTTGPALEEIVVTAQRRAESSQKASVSIAVVGGEALATRGVRNTESLNGLVPGFKISPVATQTQFFLRGVGDNASNSTTTPAISLNIDGVAVSRSSSFGGSFYDVERIEVLRGPQGTLYGRNASAGAVNLLTRKPVLGENSGAISAQAGNYNLRQLEGMTNLALSETVALRGAFQVVRRDGYLSDDSSDQVTDAGRIKLLYKPSSTFDISFQVDAVRFGGNNVGRVFRPSTTGNPWTGPNDPANTTTSFPNMLARSPGFVDSWQVNGSVEANWNFGPATLTVLPAYRYTNASTRGMSDGWFQEDYVAKQLSLETRLGNQSGPFKWVLGNFLYKERMSGTLNADIATIARATTGPNIGNPLSGQVLRTDIAKQDTGSYAFFADGSLALTPALRILGGLRYTHDDKQTVAVNDTRIYSSSAPLPQGTQTCCAILPSNFNMSWSAVTWKGGVEFDIAPRSMVFATANKGYKSGGFLPDTNLAYNPEYLTAFDVGIKNRFMNNRLQFNLGLFYWKYRDQQLSFTGTTSTGITGPVITNAGRSTLYGASMDAAFKVTSTTEISGSVEYLHTRYDSYVVAISQRGTAPAAGTALANGCVSGGSGGVNLVINDCSGKPLMRAPTWSGNANLTQRFDLSNGGDVTFGAHMNFESWHWLSPANFQSANWRQPAYAKFDLDLTYHAAKKNWQIGVWVQNLSNQAIYQNASNGNSISGFQGAIQNTATAPSVGTISPPRTFGGRVQVKF